MDISGLNTLPKSSRRYNIRSWEIKGICFEELSKSDLGIVLACDTTNKEEFSEDLRERDG